MIALLLELLESLGHQFSRVVHSDSLDVKLEPVLYLSEIDDVLILVVADALSAGCALPGIGNYGLALAIAEVLDVEHAHGAEGLQLLRILVQHRLVKSDVRDKAVVGSGYWRPLRVGLPNAFLAEELHLYLLTRAELGYQDVSVEGSWGVFFSVEILLVTKWDPLKLTSVDVGIIVIFVFINCIVNNHWSIRVLLSASHVQLELDAVLSRVARGGINRLARISLFNSLVILELPSIGLDRNQADSVSEVLIGDYGGILPHVYLLDGHSWDLCYQDATEGVGQRGLRTDQVKDDLLIVKLEDFYVTLVNEVADGALLGATSKSLETCWMLEGCMLYISLDENNLHYRCRGS